jgi:hypothetical protein
MTGTTVKVTSGATGRVLIHSATQRGKLDTFGELEVFGVQAVILVSNDGYYAHPIITCYCHEDEYKRFKGAEPTPEKG